MQSFKKGDIQTRATLFPLFQRSCRTSRDYMVWKSGAVQALKSLPEWIENFASLRSSAIPDCHNIRILPEGVGHLTAPAASLNS